MALTVTEANATNIVLRGLLGVANDLGIMASDQDVREAAELLRDHAHRTLHAGLSPAELAAAFDRRGQTTSAVLGEVTAERARQDAKWGEQNHPDGTGPDELLGMVGWAKTYAEWATDLRSATDRAAERGEVTYAHIALEEFFEALAESDQEKLRAELIQVAAVAVAWVEKIDRDFAAEAVPS